MCGSGWSYSFPSGHQTRRLVQTFGHHLKQKLGQWIGLFDRLHQPMPSQHQQGAVTDRMGGSRAGRVGDQRHFPEYLSGSQRRNDLRLSATPDGYLDRTFFDDIGIVALVSSWKINCPVGQFARVNVFGHAAGCSGIDRSANRLTKRGY